MKDSQNIIRRSNLEIMNTEKEKVLSKVTEIMFNKIIAEKSPNPGK